MNPWMLAWRNLARNRRRSLITGGVIVFGFTALTLAGGFMLQSFAGLKDTAIRSGLGHLQFADPRLFDDSETSTLEYGLPNADSLRARLAGDIHVKVVMPRLEFFGLVSAGGRSIPFLGAGVDPAAEVQGSNIPAAVDTGEWLKAGERGAVLGGGLARTLKVQVGDVITLLATTPGGTLNAVDATVVGIAAISVKELSERYLALPLELAQELLDAPDYVSKISVLLNDGERDAEIGEQLLSVLRPIHAQLGFKTWEQLAIFYGQVRLLYLGIFGFMGSVLVIVVFLATINTLLMAITERTREIGTLRALGTRRALIVRNFVAEGALLGVIGCLLGALLTVAISMALNASGLELPPPPGFTRSAPIHIDILPLAYAMAALTMIATLSAASYFPARRAAGAPIVEALTHV